MSLYTFISIELSLVETLAKGRIANMKFERSGI